MKLNIAHIFSELISGMSCIVTISLSLYTVNWVNLQGLISFFNERLLWTNFLSTAICVYFIGFVVDGIGLGIGDCFLDDLIYKISLDGKKRIKFFKEVKNHVFEYKEKQWSYYSSYRNLFLLIMPMIVILLLFGWAKYSYLANTSFIIIALTFEIALFFTLRMLLKLYYTIENSFHNA